MVAERVCVPLWPQLPWHVLYGPQTNWQSTGWHAVALHARVSVVAPHGLPAPICTCVMTPTSSCTPAVDAHGHAHERWQLLHVVPKLTTQS